MLSRASRGAGLSPDTSGRLAAPSPQEAAFLALFADYEDSDKGYLVTADKGGFRNGLAGDPASKFSLLDRAFGRKFLPTLTGLGIGLHPHHIEADTITGRPCWASGCNGVTPNPTASDYPGVLQGDGAVPVVDTSGSWSVAQRVRLPPSGGGSLNGKVFTTSGGYLTGMATADPDKSLAIGVADNGRARAFNQAGSNTIGTDIQFGEGGPDLRDGVWHNLLWAFDDAAQGYRLWIDRTSTSVSGSSLVTTDVSSVAGKGVPVIGGFGAAGANGRFSGLWSVAALIPAAIVTNAQARDVVFDYLETK
jgi:hypothetical protein